MTAPVQLSDLSNLPTVSDTDEMLVRSGTTDYRALVSAIRNINFSNLPDIPSAPFGPVPTDYMALTRAGVTYRVTYDKIGFSAGVRMWFYLSAPPNSNWVAVAGTGDTLLAVAGGSTYTPANTVKGDWSIPGTALTIDQIPNHAHKIIYSNQQFQGLANLYANTPSRNSAIGPQPTTFYESQGIIGSSNAIGSSQSHTHGPYRPMASVGNIFQKVL